MWEEGSLLSDFCFRFFLMLFLADFLVSLVLGGSSAPAEENPLKILSTITMPTIKNNQKNFREAVGFSSEFAIEEGSKVSVTLHMRRVCGARALLPAHQKLLHQEIYQLRYKRLCCSCGLCGVKKIDIIIV